MQFLDSNGIIKSENNFYIDVIDSKTQSTYSIPLNNLLTPEEYIKFENLGLKKMDQSASWGSYRGIL